MFQCSTIARELQEDLSVGEGAVDKGEEKGGGGSGDRERHPGRKLK